MDCEAGHPPVKGTKPKGTHPICDECRAFADETTIHGFAETAKSGCLLRLFWFLLLSAALALSVFELKNLVGEYMRNPPSVMSRQVSEVEAPRIHMKIPITVDPRERLRQLEKADTDENIIFSTLLDHFLYHAGNEDTCPGTDFDQMEMWISAMTALLKGTYDGNPYANAFNNFFQQLQQDISTGQAAFEWIAQELEAVGGNITFLYEKFMYPEWKKAIIDPAMENMNESVQPQGKTFAFMFNAWDGKRYYADTKVVHAAKGGPEIEFSFPNQTIVKEGYIDLVTYACDHSLTKSIIAQNLQLEPKMILRFGSHRSNVDDHSYTELFCDQNYLIDLSFYPESFEAGYCDPSIDLDPLTCTQACWVESTRKTNRMTKDATPNNELTTSHETADTVGKCLPYFGQPLRRAGVPFCGFEGMQCDKAAFRPCKKACGQSETCRPCRNLRVKTWIQAVQKDPTADYELSRDPHDPNKRYEFAFTKIKMRFDKYTTVEAVHYEPKYDPVIFLSATGGLLGICFGASIISIVQLAFFLGRLLLSAMKACCGGAAPHPAATSVKSSG